MKLRRVLGSILLGVMILSTAGCASETQDDVVVIELVQSKMEAVDIFEELAEEFNEAHDDIQLVVSSPNDAMTILKTRFIREDYPDIIAIGGEINYSYFLDADLLMDISDLELVEEVKDSYLEIDKNLELIPQDGVYALPYVANASGVLYNVEIFEEYGWEIPVTWSDFIALCDEMEEVGVLPFYYGYKDTWTCLATWNPLASSLSSATTCTDVNLGLTTFSTEYVEVAEKVKVLVEYGQDDPYAYGYNDACTAFARGESAMFLIGSYAVSQIESVNPDIMIDSFTLPASDTEGESVLTSGIDLQFSVLNNTEHKEEAYIVLEFLYEDENIQKYLDDQYAIPCKEGEFELASIFDGMLDDIEGDNMVDYQDHYYPSEMSVDAMLQTFYMDDSEDATTTFLEKFDTDWVRYNQDLIIRLEDYMEDLEEEGN